MNPSPVIHKVRFSLSRLAHGASINISGQPRIKGYRNRFTKPKRGRALLVYVVAPLQEKMMGIPPYAFSNYGLAVTWLEVLAEVGFKVDVINWDDTKFVPSVDYDLVIFHGAKNFERIFRTLRPSAATIYFSTGSYWAFHNQQELERFSYFEKRHGKKLPFDRYIYDSEEGANKKSGAIICLGNQDVQTTYKKFPCVYSLPIGALSGGVQHTIDRDYSLARKNFFFFSGGGNIHKGLDVLIDAIEGTDLSLYIGTRLDPEFEYFYRDKLFNSPNIHYEGFVHIDSVRFNELMKLCAFVILPSCSEGSPGSVVDCMLRGQIPVVTKNAHLDIDQFGVLIENYRVGGLRRTIVEASKMSETELVERSNMSEKIALTRHSPTKFKETLRDIVLDYMESKAK